MAIEDFIGQHVNVVVTLESGKFDKKLLKVCKANTRKDKFDMFPQQELLDMLMGL